VSLRLHNPRAHQQGLVLVSSLLLLLVVTILALAMFRSMGLQEKIAGNVREKQRALHAAVVAQQYAEWWLSSSNNSGQSPVICNATANANLGPTQVLICTNSIAAPATLPWTSSGATVGITYYPSNALSPLTSMNFAAASNGSLANAYYLTPSFYIQYLGPSADGGGTVYKIDAVGYGGNALSVAVVESTYEIGSAVTPRNGL
jgi:type IV pilus assembly protein PilX